MKLVIQFLTNMSPYCKRAALFENNWEMKIGSVRSM